MAEKGGLYQRALPRLRSFAEDDYIEFVFGFDRDHYLRRIQMAGFTGKRHSLDAGCGYGQWTEVLAGMNEKVTAVDRSSKMLEASRVLNQMSGHANIDFLCSDLASLPLADGQFDAIWCWGVLSLTNRHAIFKEFYRLLKPDGRLFFGCVNARGRWTWKALRALRPNKFNWEIVKLGIRLTVSQEAAEYNRTSLSNVDLLGRKYGYRLVAKGHDGHIDLTGQIGPQPMFSPTFLLMENNIEFLFEKNSESCLLK